MRLLLKPCAKTMLDFRSNWHSVENWRLQVLKFFNRIHLGAASLVRDFEPAGSDPSGHREQLARYRGETETGLMKAIKAALEPKNIINPAKVICRPVPIVCHVIRAHLANVSA